MILTFLAWCRYAVVVVVVVVDAGVEGSPFGITGHRHTTHTTDATRRDATRHETNTHTHTDTETQPKP